MSEWGAATKTGWYAVPGFRWLHHFDAGTMRSTCGAHVLTPDCWYEGPTFDFYADHLCRSCVKAVQHAERLAPLGEPETPAPRR